MATLFGTLAAVVLALSLWIGFRNQTEYKAQIEDRQKAERNVQTSQEELESRKATLNSTIKAKEDKLAEKEATEKQLAEAEAKLKALTDELASAQDEKKSKADELASQQEIMKELPDPDVLKPQIDTSKKQIAQLKSDIEDEKAKIESLEAQKAATTASIERMQSVNSNIASGNSQPDLSTTIRSVYRTWGFVTLNGGDAQGVVPGSTLDVVRNGEVIAKLRVTTVEPSKAAADIVIDEDATPVSLRSGDRVVAEQKGQ